MHENFCFIWHFKCICVTSDVSSICNLMMCMYFLLCMSRYLFFFNFLPPVNPSSSISKGLFHGYMQHDAFLFAFIVGVIKFISWSAFTLISLNLFPHFS
uniref:BTB/POZ domain-containing protein KCTD9 n=1 Tax=Rhizophora mucronata TaxID=61149 RepID=A0A2P2LG72_RHIMU